MPTSPARAWSAIATLCGIALLVAVGVSVWAVLFWGGGHPPLSGIVVLIAILGAIPTGLVGAVAAHLAVRDPACARRMRRLRALNLVIPTLGVLLFVVDRLFR